jgi:CheY-like chemotaxis protein
MIPEDPDLDVASADAQSASALSEALSSALGRCLFSDLHIAVAFLDDDAKLADANLGFCHLVLTARQDLRGLPLSSFLLPSARTLGAAALAGLRAGRGFEGEFPILAADGSLVEVDWSFQPQVVPGLHLAIARDIRAERQLQRMRRELEAAKNSAEEAMEAKDRFFAALSHELRTPLAPAMLTLSALSADPEMPERFSPALERIRRNLALEARLIDDLLARGTNSAVVQSVDGDAPKRERERVENAVPHVLLVEDHADTAEALTILLVNSGYRVTHAGSMADALAAAIQAEGDETSFDLVLSDLGLPDGHGYELMRVLGRRHGLPGIALSGYGMEEDVRGSLEAGFARHLTKPVEFQTLLGTIREVIG